ncbi:hypothetical protein C1645_759004 [Glomus cerebriforme]|uniref:Uncharacterized protein n=1 Tax=Glomus cerebriforme TaxID=658196 RepID=A0A397TBS9_9GLOM|nr:hypothetical protein C1645_759004 [Glomus cerebriforme]
MFTFWRVSIAFLAVSLTSIVFFYLVRISIYDIKFSDNLPSKGIHDIPPSDTIIPNIFAQIPLSSLPSKTTVSDQIHNKTKSLNYEPPINFQLSPQQCFDYAKNCRDIQCAFKDFNVNCNNNNGNGPICTCGTSQINSASSISSDAHFVFFTIFISVISLYYYI